MAKQLDRCHRWPACICGEKWSFFQDAPTEAFAEAEPIIAATLACVSARCPDPRFRAHAAVQLLNPIFSEWKERLQ
ncbi:hypothetical protein E4K64_19155 [Bradyrhizobium frederickii]|uniref:Uncharacterized protein n=1 Tax=Bradyrhizobium frederickii TaxID=2560054 RepID=A0A4Y9P3K2_9BRAD|nr:hypothetical protein [Bradyrhizobium frederickii]TFV74112.1 hypothetical protein E4K64_19155 [Bradyrhizobium frederickii]